MKTNQI